MGKLSIKLGGFYQATSTDDSFDDSDTWVFEIVSRIEHNGMICFIGIMADGTLWNGSAQIFLENGLTVDTSENVMGFRIVKKIYRKKVWDVTCIDPKKTNQTTENQDE